MGYNESYIVSLPLEFERLFAVSTTEFLNWCYLPPREAAVSSSPECIRKWEGMNTMVSSLNTFFKDTLRLNSKACLLPISSRIQNLPRKVGQLEYESNWNCSSYR